MGRARGTYGTGEGHRLFWWDDLREKKTPLGTSRRKRDDNIKIDLQEVRWRSMDWIDLAQDRDRWRAFVKAVMDLRVPQNAENFLTS